MAETLISPGVLARENDQSQVTSQPITVGATLLLLLLTTTLIMVVKVC